MSVFQGNPEAFAEIMRLYCPPPAYVLDVTYDRGVFWQNIDEATYHLERNVKKYDFAEVPFNDQTFDVVVFDPPYRMSGTLTDHPTTQRYGNENQNYKRVPLYYENAVREAHRVLKMGGILIAKMQDQVVSGQIYFQTNQMMLWAKDFKRMVDEVHVVNNSRPQPPGRREVHIRRMHSTFQVWVK